MWRGGVEDEREGDDDKRFDLYTVKVRETMLTTITSKKEKRKGGSVFNTASNKVTSVIEVGDG